MKIKNVFKIMILFSILIMLASTIVLAGGDYSDPNQFDAYTNPITIPGTNNVSAESLVTKVLNLILSVLRIIAFGWALIMAMAIAIKYMVSKPEMKAALKEDMRTYIIGALLLFGASGLLTLVQYFVDDFFTS